MTQYVYTFGAGKAEGAAHMKDLLGGKGANLAEMTNLAIPVPPGFTITTDVCTYYYQNEGAYPESLRHDVKRALRQIESVIGKRFGDAADPLLVSVRSGARSSMPGMMDTVLNLGLNDETVCGVSDVTHNPRFAFDCYRRFVAMYGDVVMGLKPEAKDEEDPFERILVEKKRQCGVALDTELQVDDLKDLIDQYKAEILRRLGKSFPEDPMEQLWGAIGAVFGSWQNRRAIEYRKMYKIPDDWGTAVNIQAMVFGNTGDRSGTGVAFSRNPATGEKSLYGEFLVNAQGEDVVAGIRTPLPISHLQTVMPEVFAELSAICDRLEQHYADMQDMEFTIEDGRLWMLQTRTAKRTGMASVRIAVEMVEEGLIQSRQAIMRVEPEQLTQLLGSIFDVQAKSAAVTAGKRVAVGLPAGPGAASGRVVFSAYDAVMWNKQNEAVILVRIETSPEDIMGMKAAEGILTAQGGMTSHAALVARQMGKVCVAGCGSLEIDYRAGQMRVSDKIIREGDWISIDGSTGEVIEGQIATQPSEILQVLVHNTKSPDDSLAYQHFARLMRWADEFRKLRVRANADQSDQAREAIAFGAEGIGLCRTEHMFFGGDRIQTVRRMILAEDDADRRLALAVLQPIQRNDFLEIFRQMQGLPVTIRLLDPPLHEFLPQKEDDFEILAQEMSWSVERVKQRTAALHEFNPMLGHRGCRLGITFPDIYAMQVQAIFEAAMLVQAEIGSVCPEIMIPLTGHRAEMDRMRDLVDRVAEQTLGPLRPHLKYQVGTMLEVPRACLIADKLAEVSDFFSFGTNDLTQTTYGISRDDGARFLPQYIEQGIYKIDPFVSLDQDGVGQLVETAVRKGRDVCTTIKIGICGEHGGDPDSVHYCHNLGFDYVSCSAYRVPIARLAAAQAAIA